MSHGNAQGNFFAIDRRTWARSCELGLNKSVGYLVLACFTGRDNRTTNASVQAIEKYTGISRSRAKRSIEGLIGAGLIRPVGDGTKPRYDLLPAHEVPGTGVWPPEARKPMTARQQEIYDQVATGQTIEGNKDRAVARYLVQKAWLAEQWCPERGRFVYSPATEPDVDPVADWIWLPNELVTGAADETSPVERLRQTQNVMNLRLLVDLYYAQNLLEDGGVSRFIVYQYFDRTQVGECGEFRVWGFEEDQLRAYQDSEVISPRPVWDEEIAAERFAQFWSSLDALLDRGLIEFVPHLFESEGPDAEPIHPYGVGRTDSLEDQLGMACRRAAIRLITDEQRRRAGANGYKLLAPVPRHVANVQMIGIARLRYRLKTKLTAAWQAGLKSKGEEYIFSYNEIAKDRFDKIALSQ